MLIHEINNQAGFHGASNHPVRVESWEEAEAVLEQKFPDRTTHVSGPTAQGRIESLRKFLDKTCAVTFHITSDE